MKYLQIIIVFIFSNLLATAQQIPIDNQYMLNTFAINPAFAGANGNIEAFMGYRGSWMGIHGAPRLSHVNLNALITESMGVGVCIKSESSGSFEHFHGSLAYAYHLALGEEFYVSLGIEAMFYRNQLDISKVESLGLDPVLENATALNGTAYDAGAGIGVWMRGFTIAVSGQRFLGSRINYGGDEQQFFYQPDMQITAYASYMIAIGKNTKTKRRGRRRKSSKKDKAPKVRLEPQFLMRYTMGKMYYEGAINAMFRDRFWIGGMYRGDGSIGINVGGALQERIVMNYSYEFGIGNSLGIQSSGTHDITIGFLLKSNPNPRRKHGRSLFLRDGAPKPKAISTTGSGSSDPEVDKKVTELRKQLKDLTGIYQAHRDSANARLIALEERRVEAAKDLAEQEQKKDADTYGPQFIINNIRFSSNSDRLLPSSYPELNKLAKKLRDSPRLKIMITGHTDNVGSARYNKRLSLRRAKSVAKHLATKAVNMARIKTVGMGQEKSIADNKTLRGRARNRRIEGAFKK